MKKTASTNHSFLFALVLFGLTLSLALSYLTQPMSSSLAANANSTANQAQGAPGIPEQTVLSPEPQAGMAHLSSSSAGYLSPATQAANPFTHVVVRAELTDSTKAMLNLELRLATHTGNDPQWTAWIPLAESDELWLPEDGEHVFWSEIAYVGGPYAVWQVRVVAGADGTLPQVARLEVNTVDARFGERDPRPTFDDPAQTSATNTGIARPAVVTRTGWGCPDGQSSRATPAYRYATHMVLHHTAGRGTLQGGETWADHVRGIWSFHTYTRGWGDIGYNFLIAPDGTIYEGRAGGDNAVGFHDTANYGSMGVSVIGTYDTIDIPPAAQDSLVALLAWRANTNDIAPTGRAKYYGCTISRYCSAYTPDGILDTITGHRQVTPNYTTCPGNKASAWLPVLRQRVLQQVLEGGDHQEKPDNGDLVIDELEMSFTKSEANWYRAACGDAGHTYYTYTTDNQEESTNNGTWKLPTKLDGYYRVYAHVPQGCGLGDPPYATQKATYQVQSADGIANVTIDHNGTEAWAELGTYRYAPDTEVQVTLNDFTGEPYSERRVIFFDSVKWVEETEPEIVKVELLDVAYGQTTVAVGELLEISFTVKNNGTLTVQTQNPQAEPLPDDSYDSNQGYVYEEDECILGNANLSYPVYPKEIDRFRVTLGATNRKVACAGAIGDYPWRWGLNGDLAPGETRMIKGYVQFEQPGEVSLQAGLIEEYVKYHALGLGKTTIIVTNEQQTPAAVAVNKALEPLAHVYRLADVPANLLWRSLEPHTTQRGDYVGSYAWDGSTLDWGADGPLGVKNTFIVEQTRVITVPVDGAYTFRITSNGNAWLWVDGQKVVFNNGLGSPPDMSHDAFGTVTLTAGQHVLAFRYFQLLDAAKAGYAVKMPGAEDFVQPVGSIANVQPVTGTTTFAITPVLTLVAADFGGSGIATIRYSWDGTTWITPTSTPTTQATIPDVVSVSPTGAGKHTLRYQAIDQVGNKSEVYSLSLQVDLPTGEPSPVPTEVPTEAPTEAPIEEPTPTSTATPTPSPTATTLPTNPGMVQVYLPMVQRSN